MTAGYTYRTKTIVILETRKSAMRLERLHARLPVAEPLRDLPSREFLHEQVVPDLIVRSVRGSYLIGLWPFSTFQRF